MVCAPTVNDDVAPLTCPNEFGVPLAIVVLGIELQLVPSKIVTVPVLTAALVAVTFTVAVNVTDWPTTEGFAEEETAVVVATVG